ncbi:retrovirus-related pol polyprotein from transposon TNT 1-94 [Tanacetum coccineum]
MLRVFPITLTGAAKRWVDRLSPGTVDSWDLLKKAFIQRYYPPSKTTKQLEEICNFKQEGDERLYQAWEQYNDMLYKCPIHDINSHQKTMADHSQKWHDGSSGRNIDSSSNSEGIGAIVNKLDSLGHDMKKLKENVHAIQVGCQTCGGAHLDKECPFNEEVKKYDQPSSGERRPSLTKIINKYIEEAAKRHAEQDEWLKKLHQTTKTNREAHDNIIQDLKMKVRTLTNEVKGRANGGKFKECKEICTEYGSLLYTLFYYSPEEIEYFSANSGFFDNERQETDKSRMTEALAAIEATLEIKKLHQEEKQSESYEEIVYRITEVDKETYSTPKEKRVHWCKAILQEKENERQYWASCDPNSNVCDGVVLPINEEKRYWESINESKQEELEWEELGLNDWMKIRYEKVTRYTIDTEEIYTKVKVLGIDEMPRTRNNVASIRARLMEKMANQGNGQAQTFSQQVDACPNACEMWKAIERLKQGKSINVQDLETNLYWEFGKFTSRDGESLESYYSRSQPAATKNRGKAIVNSPPPTYDQEHEMVAKDDALSKEKEIDKLMDLISLSFNKIYKPTNNNPRTSSNTSRANQDNTPRINRGIRYDNQREVNVVGAKENVARECQKPKRAKDAAYHKEKMLLCKQEEARFQLNAEQVNWRDDTDDEPEDQELKAHYLYMA